MDIADPKSKSSLHFTYAHPNKNYLQQGDILKKTDALKAILADIHGYYTTKEDYTNFLVLTQTCDLRPRAVGYKAKYITLAVVRPLDLVLNREFEKIVDLDLGQKGKVGGSKHRNRARQFVESLLNNNINEYFYLHEETTKGLHEACCAFLRLSISIKIDHYDACFKARFLSLDETFQAKLGWLTGNMYSRVGTEEWEAARGKEEYSEKINQLLEQDWLWVDDKKLLLANQDKPDNLLNKEEKTIRDYIKNFKIKKPRTNAITGVLEVIKNLKEEGTLAEANDETITKRLNSHPLFDSSFK